MMIDESYIPVAKPSIGRAERIAVDKCLASGWLTRGPEVDLFEGEIADYLGVNDVLCVSSCTAALHLAALTLERPGIVLVPSLTFCASANAPRNAERDVRLVDVCPSGDCASEGIRKALCAHENIAAVVLVHYGGKIINDYGMIALSCLGAKVEIIEDAAHAFGSSRDGIFVGARGRATCFSFYATKNITTMEGGALCGLAPERMARVRRLAMHGIDSDAWKRYAPGGSPYYSVEESGWKYNMTDPQAAMGRVQLRRLPEMMQRRQDVCRWYREAGFPTLLGTIDENLSPHIYPILCGDAEHRERVRNHLASRNIGTSIHYVPLHRQPAYFAPDADFPVASDIGDKVLSIPLYPDMTAGDVDRVVAALKEVF